MTGAPVPEEAAAAVMQEDADSSPEGVSLKDDIVPGQNIRRIGEDIRRGETVINAGVTLGPTQLPLLASLGIIKIKVLRKIRVTIFSTGDELVPVGKPLSAGKIYDSNRFAIRLMLQKLGWEIIDLSIVKDDASQLRQAFATPDRQADLVISTGGVSVSEADFTRRILQEMGKIAFWKLTIKPGKPFAFGQLSNSIFCGLPGNPVSAVVTFCQLVMPLLRTLQGITGTA